MICQLYKGHWELILAKLAESPDVKFANAVSERVTEALGEQPDAVCVAVEGREYGFEKMAKMIAETLPEIANVIRMLCASARAMIWWDKVDTVLGVSR